MRILIHALVVLMIIGLLGGLVVNDRRAQGNRSLRSEARAEVLRFRSQLDLQMALSPAGTRNAYPRSIDPAWFGRDRPSNPLLEPGHPWVEIAGSDQPSLRHPHNLIAADSSIAAFWYNPGNGVLRARVPVQICDANVLEIYNDINDCDLDTVFHDR